MARQKVTRENFERVFSTLGRPATSYELKNVFGFTDRQISKAQTELGIIRNTEKGYILNAHECLYANLAALLYEVDAKVVWQLSEHGLTCYQANNKPFIVHERDGKGWQVYIQASKDSSEHRTFEQLRAYLEN